MGVYEIKPEYSTGHRMYAYWDGLKWSFEADSTLQAENMNQTTRSNQQVTWRGIVK